MAFAFPAVVMSNATRNTYPAIMAPVKPNRALLKPHQKATPGMGDYPSVPAAYPYMAGGVN